MTTKKNYVKPSLQVVMIEQTEVIAVSGRACLYFNLEDPEEEGNAD